MAWQILIQLCNRLGGVESWHSQRESTQEGKESNLIKIYVTLPTKRGCYTRMYEFYSIYFQQCLHKYIAVKLQVSLVKSLPTQFLITQYGWLEAINFQGPKMIPWNGQDTWVDLLAEPAPPYLPRGATIWAAACTVFKHPFSGSMA